jgi:hypothetical protein
MDGWSNHHYDPEAKARWELLEREGIVEHVQRCRSYGIELTVPMAVRNLLELREAFGPEFVDP